MRLVTFWFFSCHWTEPDAWSLPWMKAFRTVWDGRHCLMHRLVCPHTPNIPDPSDPRSLEHTYSDTLAERPSCPPHQQCVLSLHSAKWHNRPSAGWVCLNWAAWCSSAVPIGMFYSCSQLKLNPFCNFFFFFRKRSEWTFSVSVRFTAQVMA